MEAVLQDGGSGVATSVRKGITSPSTRSVALRCPGEKFCRFENRNPNFRKTKTLENFRAVFSTYCHFPISSGRTSLKPRIALTSTTNPFGPCKFLRIKKYCLRVTTLVSKLEAGVKEARTSRINRQASIRASTTTPS